MKAQKFLSSFSTGVSCNYSSEAGCCTNARLVSENKLQSLIAKALRTDLNKSVELSMKAVRSPIKFQGWHLLTA